MKPKKRGDPLLPQSARTLLATASHEIRAPVHTILGMSELLAQTTLSPSQRQYLDALRRSAASLATLLDDILDLSKLSQGDHGHLRAERFWLPDLTGRVVEAVRARADEKNLGLRVVVADRVPKSLVGDLVRLQQVLVNLVVNAIKYTPTGEVVLGVDGFVNGANADVVFTVKDTGPGIPEEKLNSIVEAWQRLPQHDHIDGLGLGLSIARRIVDAMQGSIDVETSTGADGAPSGSTFSVRVSLPLSSSTSTLNSSTSLAVRSLRFLVVGAAALADEVRSALAAWAPRIEHMADEEEAERAFHFAAGRGEPFHVVVIDAHLKNLGAVGLATNLHGRAMVFVALPTRALADFGNLVEGVGATPLLLPLTTAALYGALERTPTPTPAPETELASARGRVIHCADDDNDARVLLQAFFEGTGLVVHLHDSVKALLAGVLLAPESVSLVVCDVEMQDEQGTRDGARAVMQALRGNETTEPIPVVALTAHSDPRTLAELARLGFAEVMQKPFSRSSLINLVLRRSRSPDGSPRRHKDLQLEARMALARRDHRAVELLAARVGGAIGATLEAAAKRKDDAAIRAALRELDVPAPGEQREVLTIHDVDDAVRALLPDYLRRRAQDARDIADAVAAGRFETVAFIGHKMAGTGVSYGMPQLSEIGARLEVAGKKRDAVEIGGLVERLQGLLPRDGALPRADVE
jgi:FixJ family two-component response regulator